MQELVTLVHLRNHYGQMVICRGDTLYLSRRLELSYDDLQHAGRQDSAVQFRYGFRVTGIRTIRW